MYLLRASFDPDLALAKASELLALQDAPDRLAEKLGLERELERIVKGVAPYPPKQLVAEVEKLRTYLDLDKQVHNIERKRSPWGWLGRKMATQRIDKLTARKLKLGALLEGPRRFYKQERVWLLHAIRDYALEASHQRDAQWFEWNDEAALLFPLVAMFEEGDVGKAKTLAGQLERPLARVDAKFLLAQLEGHRALRFDFEQNVVYYFTPTRGVL